MSTQATGYGKKGRYRKFITIPMTAVLSVSLFIAVTFTVIDVIAASDSYYDWRFRVSRVGEVTGIPPDDLAGIREEIQALLRGELDEFSYDVVIGEQSYAIFGEQENFHMMEVAEIFVRFRKIRWVCVFLTVFSLVILGWTAGRPLRYLRAAIISIAVFFAVVAVLCLISFNTAFEFFHGLLFDNDLWMFPMDSFLIRILDVNFFSTIAAFTAIGVTGVLLLVYGIAFFAGRKMEGLKK